MNAGEKSLLMRDREFCELTQKTGHNGWKSMMLDECVMGTKAHEPYIKGREKINKLMEFIYAMDQLSFTWEPELAFCSKDETLGVTTGTYTRTYHLEGVEYEEFGKYATTWKKHNNQWFVVFDIGN